MQPQIDTARLSVLRAFSAPAQCPLCAEVMVAPLMSEFVEGGEIRHHWACDSCGQYSCTSIPLSTH